jgi:hypothetical protein
MPEQSMTRLLLPLLTLCLTVTFGIRASADKKDPEKDSSYSFSTRLLEASLKDPSSTSLSVSFALPLGARVASRSGASPGAGGLFNASSDQPTLSPQKPLITCERGP